MKDFEFILTSYNGCDCFVTEIWYGNHMIAIVKDNDEVQLFNEDAHKTLVESDRFNIAIDTAKKKLKP